MSVHGKCLKNEAKDENEEENESCKSSAKEMSTHRSAFHVKSLWLSQIFHFYIISIYIYLYNIHIIRGTRISHDKVEFKVYELDRRTHRIHSKRDGCSSHMLYNYMTGIFFIFFITQRMLCAL